MTKNDLKWKDVPEGWALCFTQDCPLREMCLRWQAAQLAPDGLTVTRCVTPRALTGDKCKHFATMEPVRYALGFSTVYDKVRKDDFTPMRKQMTNMLSGKRYYYEYKRGDRRLTPEQQRQIRQLFTAWGYADSVRFDNYEEALDFHWI